ncbi:MAG: cobalamin-binding protein [bacterium]|nr:cobalamin-binding protein [bacterium]MDD5756206.1 cobalamin-binding protein [bacterium]
MKDHINLILLNLSFGWAFNFKEITLILKRDYTDYKQRILLIVFLALLFYCRTVCAVEKLPERIISLAPANTEILYALHLGDKVVGVSSYCNYPPPCANKEKVGDFSNPNIEKIAALKPDLILAAGLEQDPAVAKLRKLGFTVFVIDPQDFNQLFDSITRIGELTGTGTLAFNLNQSIKTRMARLKQALWAKAAAPLKFFIEISVQPLMTASRYTFLDEMITFLQAKNVAGDLPRPYCRISEEFIIRQNPDYIILTSPHSRNYFTANKAWNKTTAVQQNHLIDTVNPDLMLRPGPRLIDGLEQLAEKIYYIKIHRPGKEHE